MPTYRIVHNNQFVFEQAVSHCLLEARLLPLSCKFQTVNFSQFVVRPLRCTKRKELDCFGNHVNFFEFNKPVESITLSAIHTISTLPSPDIDFTTSTPWEHLALNADVLEPSDKMFTQLNSSKLIAHNQQMMDYAIVSFTKNRPVLEATHEFMQRIFNDFAYVMSATSVTTTAIEAFELKKGVCQDFTHIAIACLKALNIPVRYVSGYLDVTAHSSNKKRYASDFSHAWFSVFDTVNGWVEFDPTNNILPDDTYIRLGYGCDYDDISPLKGKTEPKVKSKLHVSVEISRIEK